MARLDSLHPLRFVKTRELSHDDLKALYYIHDRVSQLLTETLAAEPTSAALWQVISAEQMPFKEVIDKYPRETVWSLLGFGESLVGGVALIIDKDTAISLVRQGGTEEEDEDDDDDDEEEGITEQELQMIDGKVQQFSEAFSTIWGEYHPISIQLATFPNTPSLDEFRGLLTGIAPDTLVANITFRVTMVAREVQRISMILPQPYLEPLTGVLKSVLESVKQEAEFEQIQERINLVDDITIPVTVELGSTQMSFSELQNIEIGDFIKLNQSIEDALFIKIGQNNTIIKGRPGTTPDQQYIAIQVTEI
ncbi:MAG: FliM/FliN family flagellar motor switch protein [Candidatus Sericytochromatia bacterium]|nr:FliM/FliN family flagellar motor switch protein [Candidatus Sericytochromatia bacterium]